MKTTTLGATLALALAACTGAGGTGTVTVGISGEDGAVIGYPAGDIMFVDGFTLSFSKVLVSVADFRLEALDGETFPTGADPIIADLHQGDAALYTIEGVPVRRWDDIGYQLAPATVDARVLPGVAAADASAMIATGAAILVEGTATDGTDTIPFSYAFDFTVDASHCESGVDGTAGLVVSANTTTEAQITIHLDHLFFDSFAIDEPNMRFEPVAAMWDGATPVTLDSLAGQTLSSIVDRDGMPVLDETGSPVVYDPGPLPLSMLNLQDYVRGAATTTAHFDGEGHCDYEQL